MNKTKEDNLEAEITAILLNKLYGMKESGVGGISESSAMIKELVHLKITAIKQEFEKWDDLQCQELDKLKILNENQMKSLASFMNVCKKHFGGMGYLMLDETLTKLKESLDSKDSEIEKQKDLVKLIDDKYIPTIESQSTRIKELSDGIESIMNCGKDYSSSLAICKSLLSTRNKTELNEGRGTDKP